MLETSFGVIAAAVGSISAIWWIPYYAVWSLVYIFMGILVIYGLAAHHQWVVLNREAKAVLAHDYPLLELLDDAGVALFPLSRSGCWPSFWRHFRSHDMGGFAKAMWTIFIIVVPALGVLRVELKEGAR